MPDLKSELQKVLLGWETDSEATETPDQTQTQPEPTMAAVPLAKSHSEIIFDYVKEHPGLTCLQLEAALPFIHTESVSSLLSGMLKRHLVRRVGGAGARHIGGVFEAVADRYMSPSEQLGYGRNRRRPEYKGKRRNRAAAAVPAPIKLVLDAQTDTPAAPAVPMPVVQPAPQPTRVSIHDIDVESLTVAEARALRDKLNALFA